MPRPKTLVRRRCLVACDPCKKRKEKCDGQQPCSNCSKRRRAPSCGFSTHGRAASSGQAQMQRDPPTEGETIGSAGTDLTADTPCDTFLLADVLDTMLSEGNNQAQTRAARVPRLFRMLNDNPGKLIYIGDSASLSFLETVRRVVDTSIGPCDFTADKFRHQLIEMSTTAAEYDVPEGEPTLHLATLYEFAQLHFMAVSGLLDLFEASFIVERIPAWVEDPMRSQWPDCVLFYLVYAIGAQVRARGRSDDAIAERYFSLGRHILTQNFMDEPNLVIVQGSCLAAWYLLTACRRNGALMHLGIATQAAYALGIHLHEANLVFETKNLLARERAWKSLRVCDLFLSASMGRPPTTANVDCNIPKLQLTSSDNEETALMFNRLSSAMIRICLIFERILSEVYSKHALSLDLAGDISKQHREWTEQLPQMLRFDGLARFEPNSTTNSAESLGTAVVVMAYYYSIILLTRPFLIACVNSPSKDRVYCTAQAATSSDISVYADACVHAALSGMDVVQKIVFLERMPKRLPVLINHVFISALTLGLAYFADYDRRGWNLESSLDQAVIILRNCHTHNPEAARYKQTIESLRSAATQYRRQRDDNLLKQRNRKLHGIFGDVSRDIVPERALISESTESSESPGQ
ncbi:hypothetical protein B0O99DRAFT_460758, partial [Bisporella sp. PMI_857]